MPAFAEPAPASLSRGMTKAAQRQLFTFTREYLIPATVVYLAIVELNLSIIMTIKFNKINNKIRIINVQNP